MPRTKRDDSRPNGGEPARVSTPARRAVAAIQAASTDGDLAALRRVVIEGVRPEVDGGRYPAKATVGQSVLVEADIYADGHDLIAADVLCRRAEDKAWTRVPLTPLVNDRWRAHIPIHQMTTHLFTIEAWIDHFGTWQSDLRKKIAAKQDVSLDLLIGG